MLTGPSETIGRESGHVSSLLGWSKHQLSGRTIGSPERQEDLLLADDVQNSATLRRTRERRRRKRYPREGLAAQRMRIWRTGSILASLVFAGLRFSPICISNCSSTSVFLLLRPPRTRTKLPLGRQSEHRISGTRCHPINVKSREAMPGNGTQPLQMCAAQTSLRDRVLCADMLICAVSVPACSVDPFGIRGAKAQKKKKKKKLRRTQRASAAFRYSSSSLG